MSTPGHIVKYNLLQNNSIAIDFNPSYDQDGIHFNNFVNNGINLQSSNLRQHNCTNNYFGETNETLIANSIKDACSGYGSSLEINSTISSYHQYFYTV